VRYYDAPRLWTKRIVPHLGDEELNRIIVHDFSIYVYGVYGKVFTSGMYPCEFQERCWCAEDRMPHPRYWAYVSYRACHWLVNFNLKLVTLAEPDRPWRIITSRDHSTVWDGRETLFDLTFLAFGVPPQECYGLAMDRQLRPGKYRKVRCPEPWSETVRRCKEGRL
jgi:hypothetical protein